MRVPCFATLQEQVKSDGLRHSYAQAMHPNPRFYKYVWWVFWSQSECDGHDFLRQEHALSTSKAMELIDALTDKNECHWVYNKQIPRDEPGITPFNRSSDKWRNRRFAPPFHMDQDGEWMGYK